jgi:hypothetical protein
MERSDGEIGRPVSLAGYCLLFGKVGIVQRRTKEACGWHTILSFPAEPGGVSTSIV